MQIITPNWPNTFARIRAFTTTRIGGFSKPPYSSFNLGMHVGDNAKDVQGNLALLNQKYGLPNKPIWLKQEHSNRVVQADCIQGTVSADAAFTSAENTICAILTADCLPILISNKNETEIAAIHAGWRGIVNGIIENTLSAMSSQASQLCAWIGPAIGPNAFQVKEKVKTQLANSIPQAHQAIKLQQKGYWLVDLVSIAKFKLKSAGINTLTCSDYCTYQNKELFYSHRRDGITGRMATLIWIATS